MKNYKIIIVLLFLFLLITGVEFVHRFTGGAPESNAGEDAKAGEEGITDVDEQQTSVDFIKDDMWNGRKVVQNLRILDGEINDLSDDRESQQKKIKQFAEQFLQMEMDVGKFVQDRSTEDAFVLYLRALALRMHRYGGSEDDVVGFFFKGLEKYKACCLMGIPNDTSLDDEDLVRWDESLQWLRGSLYDNLCNIKRHLFDSYLIGVSDESQPMVKSRFFEYYTNTTQELVRMELEFKRRRENLRRVSGSKFIKQCQRDAQPKEDE